MVAADCNKKAKVAAILLLTTEQILSAERFKCLIVHIIWTTNVPRMMYGCTLCSRCNSIQVILQFEIYEETFPLKYNRIRCYCLCWKCHQFHSMIIFDRPAGFWSDYSAESTEWNKKVATPTYCTFDVNRKTCSVKNSLNIYLYNYMYSFMLFMYFNCKSYL